MKFLLVFQIFLNAVFFSFAQETLRVLQYNLLYYGTYPTWCPLAVNNPDLKDAHLKRITDYIQPDVFCVNELGEGNTNSKRILDNVLNINSPGKYKRCLTTNNGSSSIVNMLYYNSHKLILHSQEQVSKDLNNNDLSRIINLYKLYFKNADLTLKEDTIFITFIVAHLKSGNSSADQTSRFLETQALMSLLNEKKAPANFVFSGDFNIRGSEETSFENLIHHPNPDVRFYDPLDLPGTWNNNPDFADYHTQSTRITGQTNGGCFAEGGSDDRFDFILISTAIKNNTNSVQYIPGSYKVPGQDGKRFKQSLNYPPNSSAEAELIHALYEMSDHYPVCLDLSINATLNTDKNNSLKREVIFNNPVKDYLELYFTCINCGPIALEITTLTGLSLIRKDITEKNGQYRITVNVELFQKGIYILKGSCLDGYCFNEKMIKF